MKRKLLLLAAFSDRGGARRVLAECGCGCLDESGGLRAWFGCHDPRDNSNTPQDTGCQPGETVDVDVIGPASQALSVRRSG